jgi:hypothetical protein
LRVSAFLCDGPGEKVRSQFLSLRHTHFVGRVLFNPPSGAQRRVKENPPTRTKKIQAVPSQTTGTRFAATAAGEITSISIGTRHRPV